MTAPVIRAASIFVRTFWSRDYGAERDFPKAASIKRPEISPRRSFVAGALALSCYRASFCSLPIKIVFVADAALFEAASVFCSRLACKKRASRAVLSSRAASLSKNDAATIPQKTSSAERCRFLRPMNSAFRGVMRQMFALKSKSVFCALKVKNMELKRFYKRNSGKMSVGFYAVVPL